MVKKSCKYFAACGNAENCLNCKGYEKASRSYMVDGGKGKRPRFATIEEANGFANEVIRKTGMVLAVFADIRKPNSVWKKEM